MAPVASQAKLRYPVAVNPVATAVEAVTRKLASGFVASGSAAKK
jgi:hypothetical protein